MKMMLPTLFALFILPVAAQAQTTLLTVTSSRIREGSKGGYGKVQVLSHPLEITKKLDEKGAYVEFKGAKHYVSYTTGNETCLVLGLEQNGIVILVRKPNEVHLSFPAENLSLLLENCTYLESND